MTRNHEAVVKAVRQFLGRKYDYTPRNEFEQRYAHYPAETVERIRTQVSLTAIRGLITHMGVLKEGRKALILVSEGYTNMLPPQMRDPVASIPGFGNNARNNPNAGANNPLEDRAAFSASMDLEEDLREVYATANRNNTAIYAVDPRGLTTGEFGADRNIGSQLSRQYLNSTMDTLRTLSLQTDGRTIVNRNDLVAGMKQIVRLQLVAGAHRRQVSRDQSSGQATGLAGAGASWLLGDDRRRCRQSGDTQGRTAKSADRGVVQYRPGCTFSSSAHLDRH